MRWMSKHISQQESFPPSNVDLLYLLSLRTQVEIPTKEVKTTSCTRCLIQFILHLNSKKNIATSQDSLQRTPSKKCLENFQHLTL